MIAVCLTAYAADLPPGLSAGSTLRRYQDEKKDERIRKELQEPGKGPSITAEELKELPRGLDRIYITRVEIQTDDYTGPKISGMDEIADIKTSCEKRSVSLEKMREMCGKIQALFPDTKIRVYVPVQKFSNRILYINIVKVH